MSEPQQGRLFDDYRYFFYITNDWESTPQQIVFSANDRCQQENLLAQLAACGPCTRRSTTCSPTRPTC